jgi:thiol-disulfide isomerase/thioredoxin
MGAAAVPASADPQSAIAPLLRPLGVVAYRPETRPPEFAGRTVDAGRLSLAELRGKVVIVNFWASWCAECRPEMPLLERVHRRLASRGVVVVGINAREAGGVVARYAAELGLTFPLLLDPDGTTNARFGVVGLPTTFFVGRDGRAVAFAVGPRDWGSPDARALFEALLAEPRSGAR